MEAELTIDELTQSAYAKAVTSDLFRFAVRSQNYADMMANFASRFTEQFNALFPTEVHLDSDKKQKYLDYGVMEGLRRFQKPRNFKEFLGENVQMKLQTPAQAAALYSPLTRHLHSLGAPDEDIFKFAQAYSQLFSLLSINYPLFVALGEQREKMGSDALLTPNRHAVLKAIVPIASVYERWSLDLEGAYNGVRGVLQECQIRESPLSLNNLMPRAAMRVFENSGIIPAFIQDQRAQIYGNK